MNSDKGISFIICTWNRAETLRTTLNSLNKQQPLAGLDVEVIVVDNNSTDHTKTLVDEAMQSWCFGTLRYAFEPRQGKQFALNRGIDFCAYDILAFSDDDVIFDKNWACEIERIFAESNVDLVGGKTQVVWPTLGQPKWYHSGMSAVVGAVDLGDQRLSPAPSGYAPAGANMVVRRSLFQRIGVFSESRFRHMDFEFGSRSGRLQALITYEPSLLVYTPVDSACLTKRYFRRWAFKAGIIKGDQSVAEAMFLAVPRWVYRQLLEDLQYLTFQASHVAPADKFNRELRVWRGLGTIAGCWHEKLRPSTHAQWVEKYSQKRKNVY